MATITLTSLLARARTQATQISGDANVSVVIDSRAGMMALLPNCILEVYRRKAKDPRFLRDITAMTTVAITSGTGTLPDEVMREFLSTGNFTDANNSLVTYYEYASDYNSSVNFTQLGYSFLIGDTIQYTAPAPDLATYNGNLYITSPTIPALATTMTFPTEETITDVILLLARAIRGEEKFEVVDMAA